MIKNWIVGRPGNEAMLDVCVSVCMMRLNSILKTGKINSFINLSLCCSCPACWLLPCCSDTWDVSSPTAATPPTVVDLLSSRTGPDWKTLSPPPEVWLRLLAWLKWGEKGYLILEMRMWRDREGKVPLSHSYIIRCFNVKHQPKCVFLLEPTTFRCVHTLCGRGSFCPWKVPSCMFAEY